MREVLILLSASGFDVDRYNESINQTNEKSTLLSDLRRGFEGLMEPVYQIGIEILTIVFIASIISLTIASIMRNGQWTKWGTAAMFFSFLSLLLLKLIPIMVLTKTTSEITLLASKGIILLQETSLYLSIFVLIVGFVLKAAHKVYRHPDYYRWSKSLFFGGTIMLVLSFAAPVIFQVM